jgi:putative PIN family toxin of toxin-antitoxin system
MWGTSAVYRLAFWWQICYHQTMRVVIDTNVFVGACLGVGASNGVIRACLERRVVPLMGETLFREFEAVLARDALFVNSRLNAQERNALLDSYLALCEWTRVYFLWRPNLQDESDNHLIELAVAGDADAIVTRNLRDLQGAQLRFGALRVISPEDFLKELLT